MPTRTADAPAGSPDVRAAVGRRALLLAAVVLGLTLLWLWGWVVPELRGGARAPDFLLAGLLANLFGDAAYRRLWRCPACGAALGPGWPAACSGCGARLRRAWLPDAVALGGGPGEVLPPAELAAVRARVRAAEAAMSTGAPGPPPA